MSSAYTRFAAAAAALLAAGSAMAHPGHGRIALDTLQRTVLHYLTEPEHVATIALTLVLVAGVVIWRRRETDQEGGR